MAEPARKPKGDPPRARGRGEEEEVHPVLEQVLDKQTDPSPPAPNRRFEMGRLLKSCGVTFYWGIARDHPAEFIEAKVEEWEDSGTGPGMLVRMIQEGGPVLEARRRAGTDWEARYRKGKRQ